MDMQADKAAATLPNLYFYRNDDLTEAKASKTSFVSDFNAREADTTSKQHDIKNVEDSERLTLDIDSDEPTQKVGQLDSPVGDGSVNATWPILGKRIRRG